MAQSAVDLRGHAGRAGRIPPHDLEAEESLIGAMLLSRDAIAAAVQAVKPGDFYKPAHAHIFDAILALYQRGEPADPITVADELTRAGLIDAVGGRKTILQIQSNTPAAANAAHYATIVEELSLLRRLIATAGEIAEMGYELPDDVSDTLDRAEGMIFELAERRVADSLVEIRDVLAESLDQLEKLYEQRGALTGVPSGYLDLDNLLLGLQPSALIVVAARPAMGKTAFGLGAAANIALETRRPVLVFSMEMGHLELTQRLLASEARVDSKKLRRGDLTDAEWKRIAHAVGRLGETPLFIDDNPHCSVMEMRAKCRRVKAKYGDLGLVLVDYLQLMTSPGRAESRQVEVSELSRGLKILARELDAPVMALSQLNRMPEMRQDKRPMLADLRESGCLTADTRIVRADTGETVTLGELLARGERDIPVHTVDDDLQVTRGVMTHVFPSGVKPVHRLRLRSGIEVKASPNHPFLTFDGWRRLDELQVGERVAVPRYLPEPERPTAWVDDQVCRLARALAPGAPAVEEPGAGDEAWLAALDVDLDDPAKASIPAAVFGLPRPQAARFVRTLWQHGGRVLGGDLPPVFALLTASRALAADLQLLLLRFGILAHVRTVEHPGGARAVELRVVGERSRRRFVAEVGLPDPPSGAASREVAPGAFDAQRTFRSTMGETWHGASLSEPGRLASLQTLMGDDELHGLHRSDLFWDPVESIEFVGEMPVYDATVPGTHNFVADGMVVHNSIEQDADVVSFIYRDEVYNPESAERGTAEIIVSKHRNGPTGVVRLAFLEHLTRFENMARDPGAGGAPG